MSTIKDKTSSQVDISTRTVPLFQLQVQKSQIKTWATRYPAAEDAEVERVRESVLMRGYFTKNEFDIVCHWKSARTERHWKANEEDYIRDVTSIALNTYNERLRLEVLRVLRGVDWPTASVLLHLGHPEPYPILDFRALWSLGIESAVKYNFDLWWSYTTFTRELAQNLNVSMRELDRALWQYSKENQKP